MSASKSNSREVLPIPEETPPTTDVLDVRDTSFQPLELMRPPAGAPNVVIVLIDDMGFGASSGFGGPCDMPAADRLAGNGLKFTRFHTTALCSPTRQALLTGRNHHAVNMGSITNHATSVPGYTSVRPRSAATIAEMLRLNGYNTGAFGKMHQTPPWEISSSGPFDRWPTGEGFERFYGFVAGEADQWSPLLYDGTTPVATPDDPDYHLSVDITDQAIGWVRAQQALTPDKPFFLYLPFGATHAPHHVPPEWIEKYRGRFDAGWDEERRAMLERQRELGVVPHDCELTERHAEIPAWAELSADEQKVSARLMEAFAGFAEHTDHQVGRLVDEIEALGALHNTLFLYILGDNGASAEGGIHGAFNEIASLNGVNDTTENILERLDEIGGPTAYNHIPAGWAHATNAPYQWTKQVASHWGGTRVGMVAHWPAGIQARGEIRHQWHHVIDIVPTLLEAASLPIPTVVNGVAQQRMDGVSMRYSFDGADKAGRRTTQYFEMFGNRGVYRDGWSACTKHVTPWLQDSQAFADDVWELYGPEDWSQARNLAAQLPEKLKELQELFLVEAEKNHVLPLDDRRVERFNSDLAGRPDLLGKRTSMTLYPGMTRLNESVIPNVKNKSHVITADIVIPEGGARGVVLAQGGRFGGWSLYFHSGHLTYCHNWLGRIQSVVRSERPIAAGRNSVRYEFLYDEGEGFGRGGIGTLHVGDERVARGRIERTVPFMTGSGQGCAVGCDVGSPVVDEYETKDGVFTGVIHWVKVDLDGAPVEIPADVAANIELTTQ